jgi:hypothetical protein
LPDGESKSTPDLPTIVAYAVAFTGTKNPGVGELTETEMGVGVMLGTGRAASAPTDGVGDLDVLAGEVHPESAEVSAIAVARRTMALARPPSECVMGIIVLFPGRQRAVLT